MVPRARVELARLIQALAPKASVYANFTTSAKVTFKAILAEIQKNLKKTLDNYGHMP